MQTIVGIAHVAIRVRDIAPTLAFLVGKLGFQEMMRIDRDGRLWLLYLRITDTQYLEVFPEGVGEAAAPRDAVGSTTSASKSRTSRPPSPNWRPSACR